MTGPRRLTEAEIELWLQVADTIKRRPGSTMPALPSGPLPPRPPAAAPVAAPAKARRPTAASYTPPVSGPAASGTAPPLAPFERRLRRRISGGRVAIDGVLDLHGKTQAQAHDALRAFIHRARDQDARFVLVVTGKGTRDRLRADAEPGGVLRRAVPAWLRDPGLRSIVVGFEEAGPGHGGFGAIYVRLRRRDGRE